MPIRIFENEPKLVAQAGELAVKNEQYIPQAFLDHLADLRFQSMQSPAGDLHRVASIPTALVDHWKRNGFDIHKATPAEILSKLRLEGFDHFITTAKRIG